MQNVTVNCLTSSGGKRRHGPFSGLCIHEFLAIATHPRIFSPPTPLAKAIDQFKAWLESPSLHLLSEQPESVGVLWCTAHGLEDTGRRSTMRGLPRSASTMWLRAVDGGSRL
jgi:hypothetical protein